MENTQSSLTEEGNSLKKLLHIQMWKNQLHRLVLEISVSTKQICSGIQMVTGLDLKMYFNTTLRIGAMWRW